jgi:hypothetical protein
LTVKGSVMKHTGTELERTQDVDDADQDSIEQEIQDVEDNVKGGWGRPVAVFIARGTADGSQVL